MEIKSHSYDKFLNIFKAYCTDDNAYKLQRKNKENEGLNIEYDGFDSLYVTKDSLKTSWEMESKNYPWSPWAPRDTDILI